MKRLFVRPGYRKLKLGEKLVQEIINLAKIKGYKKMVLDTMEPYYNNQMEDVIYMRLVL